MNLQVLQIPFQSISPIIDRKLSSLVLRYHAEFCSYARMCFSECDEPDIETRSVRYTLYQSNPCRPFSMPFPPRYRPSCPSPLRDSTTIIYAPRPTSPALSCGLASPRTSYTTITRRHVRTRQETIYLGPFGFGRSALFGRGRECPSVPASPRYVEYVEPGRRRRAWEAGKIEYIPVR